MKTVFKDTFESKLGVIELSINSENNVENKSKNQLEFETENHRIEVQIIDLNRFILPNNMKIETSKGWRIYITKKTEKEENLNIICKLINTNSEINSSHDCGENLDAIKIENKTEVLHIGTEDGETMKYRAENDNWYPKRLKNEISIENPMTKFIDFGFESQIPNLDINENLYLHFLIATSKSKRENEKDNPSWFAVEKKKLELDN